MDPAKALSEHMGIIGIYFPTPEDGDLPLTNLGGTYKNAAEVESCQDLPLTNLGGTYKNAAEVESSKDFFDTLMMTNRVTRDPMNTANLFEFQLKSAEKGFRFLYASTVAAKASSAIQTLMSTQG